MDKSERVIKHLKALEKEKFIMDKMPAKFTWWYKEKVNEHGVIGAYIKCRNLRQVK